MIILFANLTTSISIEVVAARHPIHCRSVLIRIFTAQLPPFFLGGKVGEFLREGCESCQQELLSFPHVLVTLFLHCPDKAELQSIIGDIAINFNCSIKITRFFRLIADREGAAFARL